MSQSYQNIEVILINDGSLDGSGEICEAYAKKMSELNILHRIIQGLEKREIAGLKRRLVSIFYLWTVMII